QLNSSFSSRRSITGLLRQHLPHSRIIVLVAGAVVGLASVISGCATGPHPDESAWLADRNRTPIFAEDVFQPRRTVPEIDEFLALTPEQQSRFLDFFHDRSNAHLQPNQRVHEFLVQNLSDVEFGSNTLSAAQTIERQLGNCMSLALVTTAYARLGGVEAGWQLSPARPLYSSEGSVIYSADHIQTRLFSPAWKPGDDTYDPNAPLRSYLLIDYFTDQPPRRGLPLRENQMIALVYQNLGVEALAEGRVEDSFWLLREALEHDPRNGQIYNSMAVLHRRAGQEEVAEQLFAHALKLAGEDLLILRNLRRMMLAQGRDQEAERLHERIQALPDPDPYPKLAQGDQALREGRLDDALRHYRQARRIAPYLHEIDQRMAQVYLETGNIGRAQREFRRAHDNAIADADRRQYQAKLKVLREQL
ncbi:MAG: tetratricopeptide repeat protein, partial [Wenzhouxiangellaceae bacterium]